MEKEEKKDELLEINKKILDEVGLVSMVIKVTIVLSIIVSIFSWSYIFSKKLKFRVKYALEQGEIEQIEQNKKDSIDYIEYKKTMEERNDK